MQHCWTRAAWPQGRALFCAASSFMLIFEKKHFFFFSDYHSAVGYFAPPGGHLAMSGDIFSGHS